MSKQIIIRKRVREMEEKRELSELRKERFTTLTRKEKWRLILWDFIIPFIASVTAAMITTYLFYLYLR